MLKGDLISACHPDLQYKLYFQDLLQRPPLFTLYIKLFPAQKSVAYILQKNIFQRNLNARKINIHNIASNYLQNKAPYRL